MVAVDSPETNGGELGTTTAIGSGDGGYLRERETVSTDQGDHATAARDGGTAREAAQVAVARAGRRVARMAARLARQQQRRLGGAAAARRGVARRRGAAGAALREAAGGEAWG